MATIINALGTLLKGTNRAWRFEGNTDEVNSEAGFHAGFEIASGTHPDGSPIFSGNPADFPVTWNQIQAEVIRLQGIEDASTHQSPRKAEYPSVGDQLDALFHAGLFPADMAAKIQAVKDKYPKP